MTRKKRKPDDGTPEQIRTKARAKLCHLGVGRLGGMRLGLTADKRLAYVEPRIAKLEATEAEQRAHGHESGASRRATGAAQRERRWRVIEPAAKELRRKHPNVSKYSQRQLARDITEQLQQTDEPLTFGKVRTALRAHNFR